MKDLFNFSETAKALPTIITNIVDIFVKHNIIDTIKNMETMYNKLYNGYPIYLVVGDAEFSLIEKYNKGFINKNHITNDVEFLTVKRLSGSSFTGRVCFKIHNNPQIEVKFEGEWNSRDIEIAQYKLNKRLEGIAEVYFL